MRSELISNYSIKREPTIKKVEFSYLEAISKKEINVLTSDGFLVLLTNEYIEKIKVQLDEKDYKICQEVIIVSNIIRAEDLDMQTYIKCSCILSMDNLGKIFIKLDENKNIGGLLCF